MSAPQARAVLGMLLVATFLTACSKTAPPPVAPTRGPGVPVSMEDLFKPGFQPPPRIRDLSGTASYSTAVDVDSDGDVNPPASSPHLVVYLLINPHNPLQAVIVGSHDRMGLNFLREKQSGSATVAGDLDTFGSPALINYFKEKDGESLQLASNNGKPLWVDNEIALNAPAASGAPAASPSAAPTSVERSQQQNEENAPLDRELVWAP
ncbi:MAG: hypothetical protein ACYCW6_16770 [Candidatus Xenobia bacterium]